MLHGQKTKAYRFLGPLRPIESEPMGVRPRKLNAEQASLSHFRCRPCTVGEPLGVSLAHRAKEPFTRGTELPESPVSPPFTSSHIKKKWKL